MAIKPEDDQNDSSLVPRNSNIPSPDREAQLREKIERKFGPLPEFSRTREEADGQRRLRYRLSSYNEETEHLCFQDVLYEGTPEEVVEYVLLDAPTQTIARRDIFYKANYNPATKTIDVQDQLSFIDIHFRTRNFVQNYYLNYDYFGNVDRATVEFEYTEDFSKFRNMFSKFGSVSFHAKQGSERIRRTDIHLPLTPLADIQKIINTGEMFHAAVSDEIHIYYIEGTKADVYGNEDPHGGDIIHVTYPSPKGYGNEYGNLFSGVPFSPRPIKPNVVTLVRQDNKLHVNITTNNANGEVWDLTIPEYADAEELDEHARGEIAAWSNVYNLLPVRLIIVEKKALPAQTPKALP